MKHLDQRTCDLYYASQAGGGDAYFRGVAHQRGYGFFSDLFRTIKPLALKAGQYLGKQLLNTGSRVFNDLGSGASFKDSARSRIQETSNQIKSDVLQRLQRGSAIKRKRPQKRKHTKPRKQRRQDIFS